MNDAQMLAGFSERIRAALPTAISDAFGGVTDVSALSPDAVTSLVEQLGGTHHLHLELETIAGRHEPRALLLILRPTDAERLFDLEPTDPSQLGQPETQLRVLAEFTEGAEALAGALAGTLSAPGPLVAMHVSGASLEEGGVSPGLAAAAVGNEPVAFTMILQRPPGEPMPVVVCAPAELAAAFAAGSADTSASDAAERAATLAARAAARRAPEPEEPRLPPPAMPSPPVIPAITAHPFAFGQIDPPPAAAPARVERDVDLILDVALNVRVELGSTHMTVEEVLGLSPGSVVELDRLAGEPVDIVVNDRLIARGEVVVVEENFGVRVTEIISARHRSPAIT